MKFNPLANKKPEYFTNAVVVLYTFCEANSIHYDVIEDAFNSMLLNRQLKKALNTLEYYSDNSMNMIENDCLGNFLKLTRNTSNKYYSRDHDLKIVFDSTHSLIDVLLNAKVSTAKIKDFIQEVRFSLDFDEQEIENISEANVVEFNKIVLIDEDIDDVA